MYKILIISLLLLASLTRSWGQEPEVNQILDQYSKIQAQINKNELLINEFRFNQNKLSWNQQLQYQRLEKYYYYFNQNQEAILSLLVIEIDSNQYFHQINYLLNQKGELVFCQEKQNNPKYHYTELQTFYKKGQIIRLIEDNKTILSSTIFHSHKIAYFIQSVEWYLDKFRLNFKKRLD
jgi:hypothetical protein